jgi:hypothetical protein
MEIGQIRGSQICLRHRHGHGNVRRSFGISISTTPMLSSKSENRMFILGMGFVGQTLASKLQNQGWLDNKILLIVFLCFHDSSKFIFFLLG